MHKKVNFNIARAIQCSALLASGLFFPAAPLFARSVDMIFLSDDRVLTGTFERKEGNRVIFQPRLQPAISVGADSLRGLVLGYKGLPACLELRSAPGRGNCSTTLLLYGEKLLFAQGGVLREYERDRIARLTFRKQGPENLVLPLLRSGLQLKLRGQKNQARGVLTRGGLESIKVRGKNGKLFRVSEREIQSGSLTQPDRDLMEVTGEVFRADPWLFFPGMPAYKSKHPAAGIAWAAVFSISLAGGLYSHQLAGRTSRASRKDWPYRILGLGSYRSDFGRNLRARNSLWGLALGIFTFNATRLIYSRRWTPGTLELKLSNRSLRLGMSWAL